MNIYRGEKEVNTDRVAGIETGYKFHRTVKCGPGATVTVWSSDSGEEHMPSEGQLVMKEGAWKMGDTTNTVLMDKEGEVIATRDTTKEKETFGTSRYVLCVVMI